MANIQVRSRSTGQPDPATPAADPVIFVPQPGATGQLAGLVMTGGASRGRGRLATVIVERAAEEDADAETEAAPAEPSIARSQTGEVRTVRSTP